MPKVTRKRKSANIEQVQRSAKVPVTARLVAACSGTSSGHQQIYGGASFVTGCTPARDHAKHLQHLTRPYCTVQRNSACSKKRSSARKST
eukprot:6187827-Pleurochrysis_carterae.AAC.1